MVCVHVSHVPDWGAARHHCATEHPGGGGSFWPLRSMATSARFGGACSDHRAVRPGPGGQRRVWGALCVACRLLYLATGLWHSIHDQATLRRSRHLKLATHEMYDGSRRLRQRPWLTGILQAAQAAPSRHAIPLMLVFPRVLVRAAIFRQSGCLS